MSNKYDLSMLEKDEELERKASRETKVAVDWQPQACLVREWVEAKARYERDAKNLRVQLVAADDKRAVASVWAPDGVVDAVVKRIMQRHQEWEQTRDLIELDLAEMGFDVTLLID